MTSYLIDTLYLGRSYHFFQSEFLGAEMLTQTKKDKSIIDILYPTSTPAHSKNEVNYDFCKLYTIVFLSNFDL